MSEHRPRGKTIDRWPFFWAGIVLMAVKYNLDRAIAWWGFHRPWYFWNYIEPRGSGTVNAVPPHEWGFYLALLLTSLPFLALGILLVLRRLRSAGLPALLCLLFFVPFLNLSFFSVLCVVPRTEAVGEPDSGVGWFARWCPPGVFASALASTLIVGLLGLGMAVIGANVFRNYGWGLFVCLPFATGLISVLIYAGREPRSQASCMGVAVLPVIFIGCGFFLLAAEGAVCLVMAAPIGIVLSLLGGMVGYAIVSRRHGRIPPVGMALIFLSLPFTMGMEERADLTPPLLCVTSSVVIEAPPETVWRNVIVFPPIPDRRDWILRTGIAYPTSSKIIGRGVGAVRHCIFSTGEFVEPIEVWDEPRLLRFSVAEQPEPMEELSPYPQVKTPHLHGYFFSKEGQFRIEALSDGRTRLEGKTWYVNRMWPAAYWQLWSDMIIHRIHLRVLDHIKAVCEGR